MVEKKSIKHKIIVRDTRLGCGECLCSIQADAEDFVLFFSSKSFSTTEVCSDNVICSKLLPERFEETREELKPTIEILTVALLSLSPFNRVFHMSLQNSHVLLLKSA